MNGSIIHPTALLGATAIILVAGGCQSPLEAHDSDRVLAQSVSRAVERELADLVSSRASERQTTTQPPAQVEQELAPRRQELDELSPGLGGYDHQPQLGPDLTGAEQDHAMLSLHQAVHTAVANNLAIQQARLQPAISEAEVVAAEAIFDSVLFAGASYANRDRPAAQRVVLTPSGLIPIGVGVDASKSYLFETGIRKRMVSGGTISVSTDLERFSNQTPGIGQVPDPMYSAAIRLSLAQPLLRGAGSTVNTAVIRLSRNDERRSMQQLRAELLALVAETETAYWELAFAWRNLAIAEWLVEVGEEVRLKFEGRREFDTLPAQLADATARVEQRKADVIRARRAVRGASDRLKVLLNDSQFTVGGEVVLMPLEDTIESPISYNLREAVLAAIENRPEIQQAILGIDDASIRQMLADNARLPLLDLGAQLAYFGMDDSVRDAYSNIFSDEFFDYALGLSFESPIGNREAEARFRQARLRRTASVLAYRQAVQQVVLDVKNALRDVIANYELIRASRSFRVAQAENLRALLVEEETIRSLTPEFLDLKFRRQETLAQARQDEIQALTNFDSSIASLYRAMGIGLSMNRIEIEIDDGSGSSTAQSTPR